MIKKIAFLMIVFCGTTLPSSGGLAALYPGAAIPSSPAKTPIKKSDTDRENKRLLLRYAKEHNFETIVHHLKIQFKGKPDLILVCDDHGRTIFDYFVEEFKKGNPKAKKEYFKDWLELLDPFSPEMAEIHKKIAAIQELLEIFNSFLHERKGELYARSEREKERLDAQAEAKRLRRIADKAKDVARLKAIAAQLALERDQKKAAAKAATEQADREAQDAARKAQEKDERAKKAAKQAQRKAEAQQEEESRAKAERAARLNNKQIRYKKSSGSRSKGEKSTPTVEGSPLTFGKVSLAAGVILALIAGKRYIDRPQPDTESDRNQLSDRLNRTQ